MAFRDFMTQAPMKENIMIYYDIIFFIDYLSLMGCFCF